MFGSIKIININFIEMKNDIWILIYYYIVLFKKNNTYQNFILSKK